MAVKAVKDTAGPDGLVTTPQVFGAYSQMTASAPTPSPVKRAKAIHEGMKALEKFLAGRKVKEAMATRNGPNPVIPDIGSEVLKWRENAGNGAPGWCGPFMVKRTKGHTVVVATATAWRHLCRRQRPNHTGGIPIQSHCLRQRREVAELKWIAGGQNPADQMTKVQDNPYQALTRIINTNQLELTKIATVERPL